LKGNVASPTAAISAAAINARFEIDDVLRVNQARTAGKQTATAQPISTIAIRPTPVLKRNVSTVAALAEKYPAELIPGILRLISGEEHEIRANPQNASIVHHAHPAVGIRRRREQNRGEQPRGYSSHNHLSDLPK
jgi:hypothetical protein